MPPKAVSSEKIGDDLETGCGDAERGKQSGAADERGDLEWFGIHLSLSCLTHQNALNNRIHGTPLCLIPPIGSKRRFQAVFGGSESGFMGGINGFVVGGP